MAVSNDSLRIFSAICLRSASAASIVLSRTYIDLLFLSTYPRSLLPYFFLAQTITILISTLSIRTMISKGSYLINSSMLMFLAVSMFLSKILLDLEISGFPFALSLWLASSSILVSVISWNTVSDAFDVRSFKRIARWITSAGSFGGLFIGLLVPVIITLFKVEMLLYILGALIVLSSLCVLKLRSIAPPHKIPERGTSPLRYPLFRNLAVGVFFLMVIDTFADYALKAEVGAAFSAEGIGKYMGPFYGIASVLTLTCQLGVTTRLLSYIGVAGLLCILPGFGILSGAGILVFPGLWLAAVFRMGESVFRYSFDNIGREIAANPLPGQVRRHGRLFLKGVATPLGTGTAALALWLIAEPFGLRGVAIIAICASLAWLWVISEVRTSYQNTLKEAIRMKRFGGEWVETTESSLHAIQSVAIHALQEKDPGAIRFGLAILEDLSSEKLPEPALKHLNSEFADVRAALAKTAGHLKYKKAAPHFIQRLEQENDPEVIWRLLEALSIIEPEAAVPKSLELLRSTQPEIKAGAILVLIAAGDLDALIEATTSLKEMIGSPNPNMRKGAASAISAFKAGKLEKELQLLLGDTDEDVCIAAIRAAAARKAMGLAGDLTSKLGSGRVSHYASRTLVQFGMPVVGHLVEAIHRGEYAKARTAIRTLARISDIEVENEIEKIARSKDVVIRTFAARQSALRARRQPASAAFRETARRFVMREARMIQIFESAKHDRSISGYLKSEIHARQKLAEMRFLYWFAVCTQPSEVVNIVPVLLSTVESKSDMSRRSAAIEFLETIASDRELKNAVTVFEMRSSVPVGRALKELKANDDPWLGRILETESKVFKGEQMDIIHKVMTLRKTALFENLPGEILLTIAEESETRELAQGQKIFSQGDYTDGLYTVASGTVMIKRDGQVISNLKEYGFFGEIGILDDSPRGGDAIAETDVTLLFIDKEVFNSITEDLPEVLKAVTKTVIGYLKKEERKWLSSGDTMLI